MLKVQKNILIFFISSLLIAYSFMYGVISMDSDETGHSIGIFIVSLFWATVLFILLSILFIKNIRVKFARYFYGGLILMLPASWFCMWSGFFLLFYVKIVEIHPVWKGPVFNLSEDGILLVAILFIMFIVGLTFFFLSKKLDLSK